MPACYTPLADGKQTNDGIELNFLKLFGYSKPRPKLLQHTGVRMKTACLKTSRCNYLTLQQERSTATGETHFKFF
jgi:hypothetical protein